MASVSKVQAGGMMKDQVQAGGMMKDQAYGMEQE